MAVKAKLRRGEPIVIDTAPLVYLLEDVGARGAAVGVVIERALDGGLAYVPSIVAAELYVKPLRDELHTVVRSIDAFLASPGIQITALDHAIARRGAEVRAFIGLGLADALIAATALERDATLVTNDNVFTRVSGLRVLVVDELA